MTSRSPTDKLRIKFSKCLGKGLQNAELNPPVQYTFTAKCEDGETLIVSVARSVGGRYLFTDRRVLLESEETVVEKVRYEDVRRAHWMFKDLSERVRESVIKGKGAEMVAIKQEHFDRIEIESVKGIIVLDGLGQAYWPTLHFFWWLLPPAASDT